MPLSSDHLLNSFKRRLSLEYLPHTGAEILVAVSGGVDSVVLLDLLVQARDELGLTLAVGHVNHHLRGEASKGDVIFVEQLAIETGLPFFLREVEVREFAASQKLSLEAAGRRLRYQALENMRARAGLAAIATAHHRDDQAETVLGHLMRGSGMRGLSGIAPILRRSEQGPVFRPLLSYSRQEILVYAQARQLQWREDQTNTDTGFLRNRLRHEVLPLLAQRVNPAASRHLGQIAWLAAQTEAFLVSEATVALQQCLKERRSGKIVLEIQLLRRYFTIVQTYVIREILQSVAQSHCQPTFSETNRILALIVPPISPSHPSIGRRYLWRNQVEIIADRGELSFGRREPAPSERVLHPGTPSSIPELGITLFAESKPVPDNWRQLVSDQLQFVDAERTNSPLTVRLPRRGDRFMPLGMTGFKKLSDFFTDHKVALHRRSQTPVVECSQGIVWICGYRIDQRFRITARTKTVIELRFSMNS